MVDEPAQVKGPEDLDPERLLATAAATAGLDDYGDEQFVEPMTRWLESVVAEGYLTPLGAMGLQAEVVNLLVNRLRFEDDLKKHPEILDEDVSNPVVLLGLARTGTTKLQRMMSTDPAVQKLAYWRIVNPAPFPDADPSGPDPRIAVAREGVAMLAEQCPELMAGHFLSAEEADEEFYLLGTGFESLLNVLRARCPSYAEWWMAQPRQRPYDSLHRILQYLQWQDGGARGRPWILKTPAHLGNVDVLYATFPDATLVQCHRDPSVAIASAIRLHELGCRLTTDRVDLHENGELILDFFSGEMARHLAQRDLLSDDQEIFDVSFGEICDDPIEVIREIHRRRGHELSPEAAALMVEWDRDNSQHKYGKFEYSLDDYGLTRQRVEAAFAPYLERFASLNEW